MNELPLPTFQAAILATHGAHSRQIDRVRVEETFEGQPVWNGEVLIFELLDHPTATRCYAWSVGDRVTTILLEPPVDSPNAAVRAAIAAEYNEQREKRERRGVEGNVGAWTKINHARVLQLARSNDGRYPWVVLCEEISAETVRYVVWLVDPAGNTTNGGYHEIHDAALADFESRL